MHTSKYHHAEAARPRRDGGLDSSLAFLRDGYDFIRNRCDRLGGDVFETRLMLQRAICMRGPEAAKLLYDGEKITRVGAMPITALKLLQGAGSVQTLDDKAHRWRKAMFLSLLDSDAAQMLSRTFEQNWRAALPAWEGEETVVLFDAVRALLTETATEWVGVPLAPGEERKRTIEFSAMIEASAAYGPRLWRALWLRQRSEHWARRMIRMARSDTSGIPKAAPLAVIALHRDERGAQLPVKSAANELINVLRPVVAVSRFIVFAAKALHGHPAWRRKIAGGDSEALRLFVEEARRLAPFFPVIGGRARKDFAWNGTSFAKGDWVLCDLYGTNRLPRIWRDPESFDPERLKGQDLRQGYAFVPQGAGDPAVTHRCPGEAVTVALMECAVRLLTRDMDYTVPAQDLSVDLGRIPAIPKSGFCIVDVKARSAPGEALAIQRAKKASAATA